ncbi:hypothetical protein ACFLZZ_02050 [Nanoarchaeota archaeon]
MALEQFSLLGSPFLTNIVLPFVLVFTILFAILEKTELLGKKRDVNAIVSLVMGLLAVGVPAAIGVIQDLIPVIAVLMIILFAWFLIFGFVGSRFWKDSKDDFWSPGLQKTFLILLGVVILGVITWATGLFDYVILDEALTAKVIQITLLVGAIVAVIAVVIGADPKGKKESDE